MSSFCANQCRDSTKSLQHFFEFGRIFDQVEKNLSDKKILFTCKTKNNLLSFCVGELLKITRLLVSGRNPGYFDCLLRSTEQ